MCCGGCDVEVDIGLVVGNCCGDGVMGEFFMGIVGNFFGVEVVGS